MDLKGSHQANMSNVKALDFIVPFCILLQSHVGSVSLFTFLRIYSAVDVLNVSNFQHLISKGKVPESGQKPKD